MLFKCNICGEYVNRTKDDKTESAKCYSCRALQNEVKTIAEKNRVFTKDTVFLICKWYQEGTSFKKIMETTDRSAENVLNALSDGGVTPKVDDLSDILDKHFFELSEKNKEKYIEMFRVLLDKDGDM